MSRYRKGSHTVYDIQFHLVWTTKYRYRILSGKIAHRAREVLRTICQELDAAIVKGHLSQDHVHMMVSAPPHLSIDLTPFLRHPQIEFFRVFVFPFQPEGFRG